MYQKSETGPIVIAVIALIVALAAGVLAWVAYDRTGGDLDQRIQESINQSGTDTSTPGGANGTAGPGSTGADGMSDDAAQTPPLPDTDASTVPQTQP